MLQNIKEESVNQKVTAAKSIALIPKLRDRGFVMRNREVFVMITHFLVESQLDVKDPSITPIVRDLVSMKRASYGFRRVTPYGFRHLSNRLAPLTPIPRLNWNLLFLIPSQIKEKLLIKVVLELGIPGNTAPEGTHLK